MAGPKSGEGISCLIVAPEDMMKFKSIELLFKLSYLLMVCCHAGVMTIRLPHDLVDDELGVATDVKPLDPELDGDVEAVDKGLVPRHIVCGMEIQSNHIEESISLGGDRNNASPNPIESEGVIEVHAPVLLGNWGR
jgi:hypothetical protein